MWVAEASLFVLGACASGRWVVGYVYFTEFLPDEFTKRYGCIVNASAAVPIIMAALTFQFLTKYSLHFEIYALVQTSLAALACLMIVPETPKYYINAKRLDEARASLNYIAGFNGQE